MWASWDGPYTKRLPLGVRRVAWYTLHLMTRQAFNRVGVPAVLMAATVLLAGCATRDASRVVAEAGVDMESFVGARATLASGVNEGQQTERRAAVDLLLAAPVDSSAAVRLALLQSPALQALLAERAADVLDAAQSARAPNPTLSYERLRAGSEVEIGRALSFGLLELLLWPQQRRIAAERERAARLRLSGDLVDRITAVRQAWVEAVAASQSEAYARQVLASAEASAELARRMESVGNFNRLTRARQEAFQADAVVAMAEATQAAVATRERLVRLLGLDDAQAVRLQLPAQLPETPLEPRAAADVATQAGLQRLDVRLAEAAWRAARAERGRERMASVTDLEAMIRRDTNFDEADGARATVRGGEIELRVPLFDPGDVRRAKQDARTWAAARQLEATLREASSSVREQYASYQTAHRLARYHRDTVIPLRAAISEETLLRYNAMLIGVFELLADSREQITAVRAAIDAERRFWLAEASLQAALVGRPFVGAEGGSANAGIGGTGGASAASDAAGH